MTDPDYLAQRAYKNGTHPIDYAASLITIQAEAHREVVEGRADNPRLYPFYGDDSPEAFGRKVVAKLLDAGWTPPKPALGESETA